MSPIGLELDDLQQEILRTVRDFVDREVIPVADEMEHRDEYPEKIVEQMKEMGLFGVTIPEEFGGLGQPLTLYALIVAELSRGWMSLSGIMNTHFMTGYLIRKHGTAEQKASYLPRLATGEVRAALSMSEPGAGSDVAAITCKAIRDGDHYVVDGQKMWVTNGMRSGLITLLCKTDPSTEPAHKGISILLVEKTPDQEKPAPGLT
ncbi:MAG TPA: acyl-CoA dehydrogenase family protein, partial [Actinomycetota bacterium]|nr:acyl-CoA dehydrogenase family protein [Actinomycetota bacterium]